MQCKNDGAQIRQAGLADVPIIVRLTDEYFGRRCAEPFLPDLERIPASHKHKCDPRDLRVKALEDRVAALEPK